MALNIVQKFSVDLNGVVENSIAAVKAVRRSEQARKEAEFQRAIANGLSYEDQIVMRQEQLKQERDSSISDPDYITQLEKSIADTKKLNRFNSYRIKYARALGELGAGKINEEQYLRTLKDNLNIVVDPELRLEIQNDITTAEGKVKTYRDTILSNQVKKAQYDGTKSELDGAISRVSSARTNAVINNNEDEVAAYDETLSALNSQRSSVGVQDSIMDFQVKSSTRGINPIEKLDFINNAMGGADANTPIKIGDRSYTSAQQFWNLERDNFLAGNSKIFGDFFDELDKTSKNTVNANAAKFGYPTQFILDNVMTTFQGLRTKSEITPFLSRLDSTQALVMGEAVDKLAKVINEVGTNNLVFKEADVQLQNISKKYGIDTSGYRLQLDERLRNLARGGVIDQKEAAAIASDVKIELPKVDQPPVKPEEIVPPVKPTLPIVSEVKPVTPVAPPTVVPASVQTPASIPPIPVATPQYREIIAKEGDTISGILNREAGVALSKQNQLKYDEVAKLSGISNADVIKPGQKIIIPI